MKIALGGFLNGVMPRDQILRITQLIRKTMLVGIGRSDRGLPFADDRRDRSPLREQALEFAARREPWSLSIRAVAVRSRRVVS